MRKTIVIIISAFFSCFSALGENSNEVKQMDIDLKWGGYYASKDDNQSEYGVFRILDFNRDDYHVAMFKEKFSEIPKFSEIENLSPFIGHAPIDSKALLNKKSIELLGSKELEADDLDGYAYYLEAHDVEKKEIDELISKLIGFSKKPPIKLRLRIVAEELEIEERN